MSHQASTTQKLLLAGVIATLTLTACTKPADKAEEAPAPQADTATLNAAEKPEDHADHESPEGEDGDSEHHAHDGHNHGDGFVHVHVEGDSYQCGDKTANIAVHNHEGEIEAHLAHEGISYDFNKDPKADRYTTDDGINDAANVLTISGDKAKVTDANGKTILDCTKAS